MKILTSFKYIFGLAFLSLMFAAQVPAQISAILERVEKHRASLQTLKASINIKRLNSQINDSDESEGKIKLIFDKKASSNSYMRVDFTKPREQSVVVNKGKFSAYTPGTNEAFTGSTSSAKARNAGGGAFAILQMSKTELKNTFSAKQLANDTVDGTSVFHLEFTPKANSKYKSVEIWVDADGMIHKMREIPISGDETTVTLSGIEKNGKIDKSEFSIKLPPGVKPNKI